GAAARLPARAHRFRRRAEGGLPGRRAVHHAAFHHGVARDRRGRLERARGPRRGRRAARPGAHASGRAPAALRRRPRRGTPGRRAATFALMSGYTTAPPPGAGGPIPAFDTAGAHYVLSGWWRRVGAHIIDAIVIGGIALVLLVAITAPFSIGFF